MRRSVRIMKKKLALCLVLILCILSTSALGEIIRPMGPGQMGYDAVAMMYAGF